MRYLFVMTSLGLLAIISGCTTYSGSGGMYEPGYYYSGYGPAYMWSETSAPNGYYYFGGGRVDSGWRGDRDDRFIGNGGHFGGRGDRFTR